MSKFEVFCEYMLGIGVDFDLKVRNHNGTAMYEIQVYNGKAEGWHCSPDLDKLMIGIIKDV
jgi:hypothetical protein